MARRRLTILVLAPMLLLGMAVWSTHRSECCIDPAGEQFLDVTLTMAATESPAGCCARHSAPAEAPSDDRPSDKPGCDCGLGCCARASLTAIELVASAPELAHRPPGLVCDALPTLTPHPSALTLIRPPIS